MSPHSPNATRRSLYGFRNIAAHLRGTGESSRLFDLLEERDFLARQADVLGGFRQGSQDLEGQVLPVAIEQQDWPRFLRHAVVALGVRGLAEALADEEVIAALVRHGQVALADDIVEQLTDPQARIRARAVILGGRASMSRQESNGTGGAARLVEELDAVSSPRDPAAARVWLATLRTVARHLGPELQGHWRDWIGRLQGTAPDLSDDAWLAVAESWLSYDLGPGSGLWPALSEATPARVRRFLPRRLAASPQRAVSFLDGPLPPPFEDQEELLRYVRIVLLAAVADEDRWSRLCEIQVDSVECVELGRELWPRLDTAQRDRLAAEVTDATVEAAFRVVLLEGLRDATDREASPGDEKDALEAIESMPPGAQLHWTLRCLAALAPSRRRRRHVRTLALHLYVLRYDVPNVEDLVRFADLIAEVLPTDLPRVLPNVVAAPSSSAATLRALATCCQREEVLKELWEKVERYAAAVSENDGEGFQLRAEILSRITGRLCARWKELSPYREARERLLPDEEDPLRLAVIDELATGGEACRPLALEVCGELRSRRLALRRRLRLSAVGESLDDVLSPAALYEAVAGSSAVGDELAALRPLLELPVAGGGSQGREELFLDVQDSDRRILAVLDLARHDLAFQRRLLPPGQIDPVAAQQSLSRMVGGVTTDQRLVALMPELVKMGSQVSLEQAVAELQESVLRLLRLEEVAWSLRAEALETILSHVGPWVRSADKVQAPGRRQVAVTFFRWIVRLPAQSDLPEDSNHCWAELLPIVLAAADCLPAACRDRLRRPWPASIEKLMNRLWRRRRGPWVRGEEGFAPWAKNAPVTLAACFAPADELAQHLGEVLDSREPAPTVQALLCLLAIRDIKGMSPLLERLAPAARQALVLRLVRHGWLNEPHPLSLWEDEDPAIRLAYQLRREPKERDAEAIAEGVAAALARNQLDPLDARAASQRRALWAVDADRCCAPLARAAVSALAGAGRQSGEQALCFWIHGWVKPRPGEEAPACRERLSELTAVLRQAETIPELSGR